MAKRVQRFRVTDAVMSTLIGLEGEIIVNLSNFALHVHDGLTEGGFALALADASNMQSATIGQDGKMTATQVTELTNATAEIIINASAIAVNAVNITTLQNDKADKIAPAVAGNIATLSVSGNLQDSGLAVTDVGLEAGTIATFNQTIAPTGWTKLLVDNDKAFRLVTGTVSSAGAADFTTVFGAGKNTGGTTLTSAQSGSPPHTHPILGRVLFVTPVNTDVTRFQKADTAPAVSNGNTENSTGQAAASPHEHVMPLDLAYVDMILAQKA